MTEPRPVKSSPALTGLALLGIGLLLRRWRPAVLDLPDWHDDDHRRGIDRAALTARKGVETVLPSNLTGSVGRSLIVMGAGLIVARGLDLFLDRDDDLV